VADGSVADGSVADAWRRFKARASATRTGRSAVALAVVALVAIFSFQSTGGPVPSPSPSPGSSQAAVHPSGGPAATESPGPTPTPEPWEDLELPPVVLIADLAADRASAAGVAVDSTFTLRSLDGTPAVELAKGVLVQPALDLRVRQGATPDVAVLAPREPLLDGVLYRFRVYAVDGSLGGSWAFRAQQPLHVVGTLPGDRTVDVPVDTGIEVTFDQDGTTDVPSHVRIDPPVAGRFESHGRTWAFVPDQPLLAATAYSVVVRRGVGIAGSSEILEDDVAFRFETEPARSSIREFAVDFASPVMALQPNDRIALAILEHEEDEEKEDEYEPVVPWPTSLPVDVYRLAGRDATVAAAVRLTGPDSWLRTSGRGLVATDDLRLVAEAEASIVHAEDDTRYVVLPIHLDPGAYLVVIPRERRTAQAILQVRTLSAYVLSSDTRSMAWVNDLATLEGVGGAIVATADGRKLGSTSADGLAVFTTPGRLMPRADTDWWNPSPTIVSVTSPDGRWIIAALGERVSWYGQWTNDVSTADQAYNRYWLLLRTDRGQYRQTDTIHAWGVARLRSDRTVPGDLELRLYPVDGRSDLPLARASVKATANGTFSGDLPIASLPAGSYIVGLFVGAEEAMATWVGVSQIRKPSYRLDITTDRQAYLDGEPMTITIRASFFDGSTLPNAQLRVSADGASSDEAHLSKVVTTDAAGYASVTLAARYLRREPEGYGYQEIRVAPVNPEEGEIRGSASVVVLPSRVWVSGQATVRRTTVTAGGRLTRVDFGALSAAIADGSWQWDSDPAGRPVSGGTVEATLVQHITTRRQIGTEYDFIEKKVVPVYRYQGSTKTLGTYSTTTNSDGTFSFSLGVPSASDDYSVVLRAADASGRRITTSLWVDTPRDIAGSARPSYLLKSSCGYTMSETVGLGEPAVLTLHDGDGQVARDGRFLFIVGAGGLVDASVSADSTFSRTLDADLLPGFTVRAIQVRDAGYVTAEARVIPDLGDLRISIGLRSDRTGYEPGDNASIVITTTGPDGRPVAADVVIQGVDEKLYAIGAANVSDPTAELFHQIGPGFLQDAATHPAMRFDTGGCGGAGGGVREAFGDVVTFQRIRTGADGRGSATFRLLDDLTSWRIAAYAVTSDLRVGHATIALPVSLPFFVEAVLAPDYLVGEQPILRLRAYGDGLRAGDDVAFTVSAPSLGLAETRVSGKAFKALRVELPLLTAGEHRITISGTGPTSALHDALIRVIHVIPSRIAGVQTRYDSLTSAYQPPGGEGLTRYLIVDAGRGSFISLLDELASATSARFDRAMAAELARQLLIDEFGVDPATLPASSFDASRYAGGLLALLPYGSGDLELSALAALVAPDRLDADELRESLYDIEHSSLATRERQIVALALRAGLGDDVVDQLRTYLASNLTIREQLWVALGLVAAADENAARAVERQLLDEHGQRFGPWVRLEVGASLEDTLEAAGLLLVLSSRLGEPFARDVARYLADHPSRQRSFALEEIAYARAMLERLPREAGRFAWTVAGERHEVELDPGEAYPLVLSVDQRAGLRLEPLAGELAVVATWTSTDTPLPAGDQVTISRAITPAGDAPDDRLVRVVITVSFTSQATSGCWQITDVAPSGLAPLTRPAHNAAGTGPYEIEGQRVSWCASPRSDERTFAYVARVVSPGTYTWEPAVIRSVNAPEIGAATTSLTYRIR